MRPNGLREAWAEDRAALGGWLTIPSGFSAEIMAHAGFDWVCVDTQHGVIDYQQMVGMLQAVSSTPVTPLVRVPWNEPGIIGKTLDAGARGVIIPMVNSVEEAEQAVRACRYAPAGARSYGPLRATYYAGSDYYEHANDDVLCIVMIETRDAVARVDEILSVPGIDAVYIGPADLSITLGLPPPAQEAAVFNDALARWSSRVRAWHRARHRRQPDHRADPDRTGLPARGGRVGRRGARTRCRRRAARRRARAHLDGAIGLPLMAKARIVSAIPLESRSPRPARRVGRRRRRLRAREQGRDRGRARGSGGPARRSHAPVDESMLATAKRLRVISTVSVGFDHVPVAAAAARNIAVTHTPVLSDAVADLTLGLMVMVARRLGEAVGDMKRGVWSDGLLGVDLRGKTLFIVGLGRIGREGRGAGTGVRFKMQI